MQDHVKSLSSDSAYVRSPPHPLFFSKTSDVFHEEITALLIPPSKVVQLAGNLSSESIQTHRGRRTPNQKMSLFKDCFTHEPGTRAAET